MSVTDLLADGLAKIKNAYRADKKKVDLKSSKMLLCIMEVLKKEGFIQEYKFFEDNKQGQIRVYLKYLSSKAPALIDIKKISKPGRRVYVDKNEIPKVLNGVGVAILTTSKGILSDVDARKENVGGEVICYVY